MLAWKHVLSNLWWCGCTCRPEPGDKNCGSFNMFGCFMLYPWIALHFLFCLFISWTKSYEKEYEYSTISFDAETCDFCHQKCMHSQGMCAKLYPCTIHLLHVWKSWTPVSLIFKSVTGQWAGLAAIHLWGLIAAGWLLFIGILQAILTLSIPTFFLWSGLVYLAPLGKG